MNDTGLLVSSGVGVVLLYYVGIMENNHAYREVEQESCKSGEYVQAGYTSII